MSSSSTLHFVETGCLAEPGTRWLEWPGIFRDPPVSASPGLELEMCAAVLSFFVGAVHLDSGPLTCLTSVLPREPSPSPFARFYLMLLLCDFSFLLTS